MHGIPTHRTVTGAHVLRFLISGVWDRACIPLAVNLPWKPSIWSRYRSHRRHTVIQQPSWLRSSEKDRRLRKQLNLFSLSVSAFRRFGVEHSLGKGEVESSILSRSTSFPVHSDHKVVPGVPVHVRVGYPISAATGRSLRPVCQSFTGSRS